MQPSYSERWGSLDELTRYWHLDAEFVPAVPATVADAKHEQWRRAVERSRNWEN